MLGAEAEAVRCLMAAGVPSRLIERAIRTIDIDPDDDADTLAVKVFEAKADLPAFFGEAVTPAPYGNKQPGHAGPPMSMDDAAKEARERFPHLVPQLPDSAA